MQNKLNDLELQYNKLGDEIKKLKAESLKTIDFPHKFFKVIYFNTIGFVIGNGNLVVFKANSPRENVYSCLVNDYDNGYGINFKLTETNYYNLVEGDFFTTTSHDNISECDLKNRYYYLKISNGFLQMSYDSLTIRHIDTSDTPPFIKGYKILKVIK